MSLSYKAAPGSTANRVRLATIARRNTALADTAYGHFGLPKLPARVVGAVAMISRACACRRGAAAAEFAMVLPVLMGLTFGTFEYGIAFYTFNTMQAAARDVGRQVAVNTLPVGNAQAEIRARLPGWAREGANVAVTQSAPANPNTNVYTLVVTMPMDSATPIQFFSRLTNPTLRTELSMKQELPYVITP